MNAQDVARLHPSTVTAISAGEVAPLPKPRASETRRRTSRVTSRKLAHDAVLQLAKELAGGDVSRLSFNDDGSVTVR